MGWFGSKRRRGAPPDSAYEGLRAQALDAGAMGLPHRAAEHPDVEGVVIDIPGDGGYATLVALADGTTSMYTSAGGGTIGAGEHDQVAARTSALLTEIQRRLGSFPEGDQVAHPSPEHTRFFVLTAGSRRVADLPVEHFWRPSEQALPSVVIATQDLLTAIRELEPER